MDLGDSPCSGFVLLFDEAREDECDDTGDPFGSLGGVLVCSVIFLLQFVLHRTSLCSVHLVSSSIPFWCRYIDWWDSPVHVCQ